MKTIDILVGGDRFDHLVRVDVRGQRQLHPALNGLTEAQALAYEKYWENFSIPATGQINPVEIFPKATKVIMEIGTGMGEATSEIAKQYPEVGFIGIELHKPGLGSLLHRINENELDNLKLISLDARILLEENFADNSLDAVHLYLVPGFNAKHLRKHRLDQ